MQKSGSYNWNKTEIKQFRFRFVSDEIILFKFYFSASYMWNKVPKQIESRRFYLQSSSVNKNLKLINMENENVDDDKAAIAAAVVSHYCKQ